MNFSIPEAYIRRVGFACPLFACRASNALSPKHRKRQLLTTLSLPNSLGMYPYLVTCYEFAERGERYVEQRKLLTNVSAFKRIDNRWGGVVWYMGEQG